METRCLAGDGDRAGAAERRSGERLVGAEGNRGRRRSTGLAQRTPGQGAAEGECQNRGRIHGVAGTHLTGPMSGKVPATGL